MLHSIVRTSFGLAACMAIVGAATAAPALAAASASATYASTLNADGTTYTYQLRLQNTGTTAIKTLWFSWIPYASFLPDAPSAITSPAAWSGQAVTDFYGHSVLWDTTGAGLAPGAAVTGFSFQSVDAPTVLAGLDHYFGYYAVGTSYVYGGAVTTPADQLPADFGVLTAVAGPVPEPATATLLVAGMLGVVRRRRRA